MSYTHVRATISFKEPDAQTKQVTQIVNYDPKTKNGQYIEEVLILFDKANGNKDIEHREVIALEAYNDLESSERKVL